MMGYPTMTVQTVDGYPQQTYQQGYQMAPPGPGQGEVSAPPTYTQYQAVPSSTSQPSSSYASQSVPMFYNTAPTSSGSQGMPYPNMATAGQMSGQISGQGSYRPCSPPSQAGSTAAPAPPVVGSIGGSSQPASVTVTGSGGPQYVSYSTYPQVPSQRPAAPHAPMVPFQGVPNPSPPQTYPVVRPNMQMNMHMQSRTTPPPAGSQYSQVAMVPGAQPIKMFSMDQRGSGGGKSVPDIYKMDMGVKPGELATSTANGVGSGCQGTMSGVGKAMVAAAVAGLPLRPVAPTLAPYRPMLNPGESNAECL